MESNIQPVSIFPTPIYKTHYSGDLTKIAEWALSTCKDQPDYLLEKGGGKSSYSSTHDVLLKDPCNELREWLILQSQLVWDLWDLADMSRYVHRSWFNWHPPGAWTDEHDHGGTHMVITVYLNQPENGGNIQFKDPMQYTWAAWPRKESSAYDWKSITVKTGDVLIFPGFLRHRTETNNSNQDRLVMTTNISIDFFNKG